MLRFPLRLTADLARAKVAQKLRTRAASPILVIHPLEHAPNSSPESAERPIEAKHGTELLATVRKSSAPIVWIAGAEPLLHPEISQLTRCIAGIGRHVFLATDATLLRRRIHEFRPVSRLFLTVQLDGTEKTHDLRAGRPGTFRAAVEGIRAAWLSGFLIGIHARIDAQTDMAHISELVQFARHLDVDGFLISPADAASCLSSVERKELRAKTAAARKLIGSLWWETFSRIVEAALHPSIQATASVEVARPAVQHQADANEEGVKVA